MRGSKEERISVDPRRRIEKTPLGAAALAAVLAGCAARPVKGPFAPTPVALAERHFFGTPLSGPRPGDPTAVEPEACSFLRLDVFALDRLPAGALGPIEASTAVRVATGAGKPVQPTARLSRGIRVAFDGEALEASAELRGRRCVPFRSAILASILGALPPGTTWTVRAPIAGAAEGRGVPEAFEVHAYRAPPGAGGPEGSPVRIAIVREGAFVPEGSEDGGPGGAPAKDAPVPPSAASVALREVSILDEALSAPGSSIVALLPAASGAPVAGFAFELALERLPGTPGPLSEDQEAAAARLARALEGAAEARVAPEDLGLSREDLPQRLLRAAEALADAGRRRRAIAHLARETGAALAGDLAISASDDHIAIVAEKIAAAFQASAESPDLAAIGWIVERSALEAAESLVDEESGESEIAGILALHLGQVGRQVAAIERVRKRSKDLASFARRLVEENLGFLEDSLPQARARALEWLAARGLAPAGYDPLAPPRERRAALEKAALDAETQTPPKEENAP